MESSESSQIVKKTANIQLTEQAATSTNSCCLKLRQSPIQAEVSPIGGNDKDKKQLEPAAIVEITQIELNPTEVAYQPFLFATAVLLDAETLKEVHFLEDKSTPVLTGSTSSSVHYLLDPDNELSTGMFLIFPDICVRKEGSGSPNPLSTSRKVLQQADVITDTFEIFSSTALKKKKLPPTALSRSFSQQGIRMKLKRQPRSNWIIENAENSPPLKRRAQDSDNPEEESDKKKVRAARLAKPKVIDNESDDNEFHDTQKEESSPQSSKNSKSRISDLLNAGNEIESQKWDSTNNQVVKDGRLEKYEHSEHFEYKKGCISDPKDHYRTSSLPRLKRYGDYYLPAHDDYHRQQYNSYLQEQANHFHSKFEDDFRSRDPYMDAVKEEPQDLYRYSHSPGPRLPPIRSISESTPYPLPNFDYGYYNAEGKPYSKNSPYLRYWQNLEDRSYEYPHKYGGGYRMPYYPENYYRAAHENLQ
ncbi:hypothetical protein HK103_005932 [Boothiomyces macroporosus]|uniref:Velvet domain-containing protein n=1 Tax=Boothiomyces macroporosus TaxID=261099 RepID=A0AAD5UM77_9FUNG|nr:hypothetical protein HK103_005932 [Boothiomyces macroporosus]